MRTTSRNPLVFRLLAASLTYTLVIPTPSLGDDLPNEDELQANYCIVILRHAIADFSTLVPAKVTDTARLEIDETIRKYKFNLHQFLAYLAPRTKNLDSLRLKETQFIAEEDSSRGTQDAQICINSCKDENCIKNCFGESETSIRARQCDELASLMQSSKGLAP